MDDVDVGGGVGEGVVVEGVVEGGGEVVSGIKVVVVGVDVRIRVGVWMTMTVMMVVKRRCLHFLSPLKCY